MWGFEQQDGKHYDKDNIAVPVVNEVTIWIILILMVMHITWVGMLLDINGAFLNGEFEDDHQLYLEVPKGMEKFYPCNVVLLLLKTIYGLKQVAYQFWLTLLKAFWTMGYKWSKADLCLYYKWFDDKLVLWTLWIDDCFTMGEKDLVIIE